MYGEFFKPEDFEQDLEGEEEVRQRVEYEKKISDLEALLKQREEEIFTLHRSHGGQMSVLKRKLSSLALSEDEFSNKGVGDEFLNGDPYIHITKRMTDNLEDDEDNAIFLGKEYFGCSSGKKKVSSGKENIYIRIYSPGVQRKQNSELSSKGLDQRVNLSVHFLSLLSGISWDCVEGGLLMGMGMN